MKIICIDDEQLALDYLAVQLNKLDDVEVIGTYLNPTKALDEILHKQVDVAMVDIQMPEINGLELVEQILELKPEVFIVFVTAYSQYAVEAFQINAIDYIVKPITMDRLEITIKRIQKQMQSPQQNAPLLETPLKINMASQLAFEVEPNVFKPLPWRTAKSEELFLYLLQNNNALVEKSSIIDLLWESHDLEKAYALLYTTIYNVRKQMKEYKDHIVLRNHSNGYMLELYHVEIDMLEWENEIGILSKRVKDDRTINAYEKVMGLNQGSYLSNYDYIWLESDRHRIDRLWLQTAHEIASYYSDVNKIAESLKWYNDIIDRQPMDEEAHFNLMKLYEANGDFSLMMQQYGELNKILRRELAGKPSEYIIEWYNSKLK